MIINSLKHSIQQVFKQELNLEIDIKDIIIEVPNNTDFGDLSTNIAMRYAKKLQKSPQDIANVIIKSLELLDVIEECILLSNFINIKFKNTVFDEIIHYINNKGSNYAQLENKKTSINIEYVSANPTGPMHIGHGRGAVVGEVMANIYNFLGYSVIREFYVNDKGVQIDKLVLSVYLRIKELSGIKIDEEKLDYKGSYLIDIAKQILSEHGEDILQLDIHEFTKKMREWVLDTMVNYSKKALNDLDIYHDSFVYESQVSTVEQLEEAKTILEEQGNLYYGKLDLPKGGKGDIEDSREQLLFKSTNYSDDKDRALLKADDTLTYFAGDMLYHFDKIKRSHNKLINIFGFDHIGYIKRIKAAVIALSKNSVELDVIVLQLVNILKNGSIVRMSKRNGNFILMSEVLEMIGKDTFKIMMISRRNSSPIDLDVEQVKLSNKDNPVFYMQYAYARIHSLYRKYEDIFGSKYNYSDINEKVEYKYLPEERALIMHILKFNSVLESIINTQEPNILFNYIYKCAELLHHLWSKGNKDQDYRFIIASNKNLTIYKLNLLKAVEKVLGLSFQMVGIELPEHM